MAVFVPAALPAHVRKAARAIARILIAALFNLSAFRYNSRPTVRKNELHQATTTSSDDAPKGMASPFRFFLSIRLCRGSNARPAAAAGPGSSA
jgi:hypothetical protein